LDEFKKNYLSKSHSEEKIELIELISNEFPEKGDSFLIDKFKREKDWKVRKKIIEAVAKGNIKEAIPFFIEALGDTNMKIKEAAITLLGKAEAVESIQPLINMLQYGKAEYYDVLISNIVKISKKVDINEVTKYIHEGSIYIKRAIPIILGKIGNKDAEDTLKSLINDPNPTVRKNSVIALEKLIDEPDEINIILNTLNDGDIEVKKAAIWLLGNLGDKRALKPLSELLKDQEEEIRRATVKSLQKLLTTFKTFKIIYDIIKKRNVLARREAVKLLGLIGHQSPQAIKTLIRLLNSKDSAIRRLSFSGILKIFRSEQSVSEKTNILELILLSLKAKEPLIRKNCAKILGRIGDDRVIEPLLVLLNDSKAGVRRAATDSLARFGNSRVILIASQFLEDPDWKLRRSIVRLLIRISKQDEALRDEALEPLTKCFKDEDRYIKTWALKALGKLKTINNIDPFVEMLNDDDPKIRIAAVKGLAKIGDKDAIKPLSNALADDNWDVRKEIEKALEKIEPDWMNFI